MLEFKPRAEFLGAAWSADGRVVLCGIEQGETDPTNSIYAVGDLKTGQIIWQLKRSAYDVSFEIALSPDDKQAFARVATIHDKLIFDMSDGAVTPFPKADYPFFAPDGKRFVRLLEPVIAPNRQLLPAGQKPHLKIAQIWER